MNYIEFFLYAPIKYWENELIVGMVYIEFMMITVANNL